MLEIYGNFEVRGQFEVSAFWNIIKRREKSVFFSTNASESEKEITNVEFREKFACMLRFYFLRSAFYIK